ncbi:MAG: hypothetical protein N2117_12200 [Anaerolineales bacterium]|nr:hypothetical protein [Anaerolineales bacterium]MCX7755986.1 hypothetical protein [Anaerolineales bacterium]MDW8277070.1 hypothetical protein [Anaerolineales bacterium]
MAWFRTPKEYLLTGLAGFLVSAVLFYLAETLSSAPNPATLIYRQSQIFFAGMVLFLVSAIFFFAGLGAFVYRWWRKE